MKQVVCLIGIILRETKWGQLMVTYKRNLATINKQQTNIQLNYLNVDCLWSNFALKESSENHTYCNLSLSLQLLYFYV